MKYLVALTLVIISACGKATPQKNNEIAEGTTLFSVGSSGTTFQINGLDNPTFSLKRGLTYTFNVIAYGHPFYIMTVPSHDPTDAYPHGVVNQGVVNGTLYFTVPITAPNILYYESSATTDSDFGGAFQITD